MQVTAPTQSTLMPVRNAKAGPTIFTDKPNDVMIRWEGAGDPQGQDWQYVPDHYRHHAAFADSVRKGVLVIGTEDEASAAFSAPIAPAGADLAAQAAMAFERPQVNDIITAPCVGPGTRAGASCSNTAMFRQSEKDKRPPLCDEHAILASQYVPATETNEQGLQVMAWHRVEMAPRQTEITDPGLPAN